METADLLHRIDELEREVVGIAEAAATAGRDNAEEAVVVQRRIATLIDALSHAQEDRESALRLNKATTLLLAEMGHDLNQPLTVIMATLEMLTPSADYRQQAMIERANAAVGRMERAFAALMEKARLESGVVTPKPRPFPLELLFAELRSQHEDAARKKGLELRVGATHQEVVSDPTLLASILHNLVANAVRYTNTGHVAIDARKIAQGCLIEVSDTGIGIQDADLLTIFDDFRQLSTEPVAGIGLGLSIVKRTASLLGHRLSVHSTPGRGSRFAVEVPQAEGGVSHS